MARLRIYTVHINPKEAHPYETAEFIGEGFNWSAFFFSGFFALYKRLWLPLIGIVAFNMLLMYAKHHHWLQAGSFAAINIGIQLLIGYHANDWIRDRLKNQGYVVADLVSGENELRAEQRFYDRFAATHQLSPV